MTAAIRHWTRQVNLYNNIELDAHKVDRRTLAHWQQQLKLAEAALAAHLADQWGSRPDPP